MSEASKTNTTWKYALITGICFALYTVYKVIDEWQYIFITKVYGALAIMITILEIAGYGGLAVASFTRKRGAALAAAGACLCVKIYVLAIHGFPRIYWFHPLAYTALMLIILLSIKGKKMSGYIWYVPVLLIALRWMYVTRQFMDISKQQIIIYIGTMFNEKDWFGYLSLIIETAAALFAGLWLKAELPERTGKDADQTGNIQAE
ncbi:MAG: hypothetical protein K6F61_02095 [Clostridiales bacterium]|nr:hypothetical protein [Clostridiales bacterium]